MSGLVMLQTYCRGAMDRGILGVVGGGLLVDSMVVLMVVVVVVVVVALVVVLMVVVRGFVAGGFSVTAWMTGPSEVPGGDRAVGIGGRVLPTWDVGMEGIPLVGPSGGCWVSVVDGMGGFVDFWGGVGITDGIDSGTFPKVTVGVWVGPTVCVGVI